MIVERPPLAIEGTSAQRLSHTLQNPKKRTQRRQSRWQFSDPFLKSYKHRDNREDRQRYRRKAEMTKSIDCDGMPHEVFISGAHATDRQHDSEIENVEPRCEFRDSDAHGILRDELLEVTDRIPNNFNRDTCG
jgi:hypothetical protein